MDMYMVVEHTRLVLVHTSMNMNVRMECEEWVGLLGRHFCEAEDQATAGAPTTATTRL